MPRTNLIDDEFGRYEVQYPTLGHAIEAMLIDETRNLKPEAARDLLLRSCAEIKRLEQDRIKVGDEAAYKQKIAFWIGWGIAGAVSIAGDALLIHWQEIVPWLR